MGGGGFFELEVCGEEQGTCGFHKPMRTIVQANINDSCCD